MKQNQNAKFGVGSSVYLIYTKAGVSYVDDHLFEVSRVSKDADGFHYSLKSSSDSVVDWCYEWNLFVSRQDAEKTALIRNLKG